MFILGIWYLSLGVLRRVFGVRYGVSVLVTIVVKSSKQERAGVTDVRAEQEENAKHSTSRHQGLRENRETEQKTKGHQVHLRPRTQVSLNSFLTRKYDCLSLHFECVHIDHFRCFPVSPEGPGPVGNGILFKAAKSDDGSQQSSPSRGRNRKTRHRRNNSRGSNVPNGVSR